MDPLTKVKRNPLVERLTCFICGMLFVEATTIKECLHSFCRKCIYQKLEDEDEDCCPVCKVGLGVAPLESLRADHSLQKLRDTIFPLQSGNSKVGAESTGSNQNSSESASPSNITSVGRKRESSSRDHGNSAQPVVELMNVQQGSGTGPILCTLVASQDKEGNSLPQVCPGSVRLKDGHLPVPYIQRYLKKKLKLKSETEVEIMCNGQPISPTLPISSLFNQWIQTRSPSYPVQVKFLLEAQESDGCCNDFGEIPDLCPM